MDIRPIRSSDKAAILSLYKSVARIPGGLARLESEVDRSYVDEFVDRSIESGVGYVADSEGNVIGEIHAYTPGLFCFTHVLTNLTIAVSPRSQGTGVGRKLFESFMEDVVHGMPEITRVELIARESNANAISFYESLGFVREGEFAARIRNVDGSFEADVPMAWTRT